MKSKTKRFLQSNTIRAACAALIGARIDAAIVNPSLQSDLNP
jgi:hypothetical protein